MMNSKKGFTLIELLAVIVILAIIALITAPTILNVIENSRRDASKDKAYGAIDAVKLAYTEAQSNGADVALPFVVKFTTAGKGEITATDSTKYEVKASGDMPTEGSIIMNADGKIFIGAKDASNNYVVATSKTSAGALKYGSYKCFMESATSTKVKCER